MNPYGFDFWDLDRIFHHSELDLADDHQALEAATFLAHCYDVEVRSGDRFVGYIKRNDVSVSTARPANVALSNVAISGKRGA